MLVYVPPDVALFCSDTIIVLDEAAVNAVFTRQYTHTGVPPPILLPATSVSITFVLFSAPEATRAWALEKIFPFSVIICFSFP
jgi:hypothetical protein